MNIFGIIGLCFMLGALVVGIGMIVSISVESHIPDVISIILGLIIWIAAVFISIGVSTQNERIYVSKFEAQKITIEQSLESDVISGAERVQLVNKAVELNGELAEKKAKFDSWYYVHYDNSIYDDVEPIVFDTEVEE